jgi:hypothetical protein
MKICWDNLEGLRYNKRTGKWYKKKVSYCYKESCKNCGESYLASKNNKGFCSRLCSQNKQYNSFYKKQHSNETKKKISIKIKKRKISKEHKINNSKSHKGNKCHFWKGGYSSKSISLYDTYASQIEWCEEVRRSPTDINILEVKCAYCGKWYIPRINNIRNRIQAINNTNKGECKLYCSDECKNICPIYYKPVETIIKEDAIRAGRLSWLELNREVQPELRKMVLERDEYQCVKCDSSENLHCHHIYPVNIEPLFSADMDNCITLCIDCHKETHKKDGCKYGQLRMEIC